MRAHIVIAKELDHWVGAGDGGQRLRPDEMGRRTCHDDSHLGAMLDESSRQVGRLVGGDAAGDAEDDPPLG